MGPSVVTDKQIFPWMMAREASVVLSRDCRTAVPDLASALAAGSKVQGLTESVGCFNLHVLEISTLLKQAEDAA